MSEFVMTRRERLRLKLQDLFLCFRSSMDPHFSAEQLAETGVDAMQFDLVEETLKGGPYFRPMSEECLLSLDKRPDMYRPPFWTDCGFPSNADSYMVREEIMGQLLDSRDDDLWSACESSQWEHIWISRGLGSRLSEEASERARGGNDPTRQTCWDILEAFATTNSLPHRSYMACHEIMDADGPIRSELMILTGLMIAKMQCETRLKHEIFPVLILSLYGSKGRIMQAHMCSESERLHVRYSEFFDFRSCTKHWVELSVRWFLNEPLAKPAPPSEALSSEVRDEPYDIGEAVVDHVPKTESGVDDLPPPGSA